MPEISVREQKIQTALMCGAMYLSGVDPKKVLADSLSLSADKRYVFWRELARNESGTVLQTAGADDVLTNSRCRAVKDMWDGFGAVFDIGEE